MEAFASHTTALALIRLARSRGLMEGEFLPKDLFLLDLIRLGACPLPSLLDERVNGATLLRGTPSSIARSISGIFARDGSLVRSSEIWLTCGVNSNRKNTGRAHVVSMLQEVRDSDICIINGVACASPELTFLQLASVLSRTELALVGMELCGIYSESPDGGFEKFKNRPAVTSPERIAATLDYYKGVDGSREARRALANVRPYAASPRESQLCVLFSTAVERGGFGFRSIRANAKIPVTEAQRSVVTGQYYLADVMLPCARLVVEYDSVMHDDPASFARDRRRRNEIELLGYKVLSISYANLSSERAVNLLEAQVRAMARRKPRELDRGGRMMRRQLLSDLGLL